MSGGGRWDRSADSIVSVGGCRRLWSAAVADEPIASPACPQPQRVLLLAVQRGGVDRALDDTHVGMRVKQLVDPCAAAVEQDRHIGAAHQRRLLVVVGLGAAAARAPAADLIGLASRAQIAVAGPTTASRGVIWSAA